MFTYRTVDKRHDIVDLDAVMQYYDSVDFAEFLPDYGLEDGQLKLSGQIVCGPFDLYCDELLRRRFNMKNGRAVPSDLFVFSHGEPPARELTKVGGLPYWPKDTPWPEDDDGKPCIFIAQFCFRDSMDLFEELPGDILLVFFEDEYVWCLEFGEPKRLRFLWQTIRNQELMSRDDMPTAEVEYGQWASLERGEVRLEWYSPAAACYGSILRYPAYPDTLAKYVQRGSTERATVPDGYLAPMPYGTRIGGLPHISDVPDEYPGDFPGRFLCQLGYVYNQCDVPYPWLNREAPYTLDEMITLFHVGDVGSLYMYLQDDGSVWSFPTPY